MAEFGVPDWHVRRAEPGDAALLSFVAGATFLEAYAGFLDRDDLLAHLAAKSSPDHFDRWIADRHTIVLVAETPAGRAPLGYAVVTTPDLPVGRRDGDIELLRIYSLATTWGSGLGAALMQSAVDGARAAGWARMLLGVHPRNVRAHRFYEKHGYAVVGRRRFQVGQTWFDDPVYARSL